MALVIETTVQVWIPGCDQPIIEVARRESSINPVPGSKEHWLAEQETGKTAIARLADEVRDVACERLEQFSEATQRSS